MKKRLISLLLAAVLLAALAAPAMAAAPKVKKTEYEGNGKVEVDFYGKVSYKNARVVVKNAAGKTISAKIIDRDDDDVDFRIASPVAGAKYTYAISGVRAGRSGSYGTVKGSFTVPAKVAIRKVEYDAKDRELDIDFNGKVKYKGVKVTVKDGAGRAYTARITEKGGDDLEVKVTGLKKGRTYTVAVSGVALKGGSYATVSKKFTVK